MTQIQNAVAENRIGRFKISMDLVQARTTHALQILAGCLVVSCDFKPDGQCYSYVAYSPDFDPVQRYATHLPEYTALVAPDGGDGDPPIRTWQRVGRVNDRVVA